MALQSLFMLHFPRFYCQCRMQIYFIPLAVAKHVLYALIGGVFLNFWKKMWEMLYCCVEMCYNVGTVGAEFLPVRGGAGRGGPCI